MITAAKTSLTLLMESFKRKHSRKIFEGDISIRTLPTTLFQIFCKIIINFIIIVKSTLDPDDNFKRNAYGTIGLTHSCLDIFSLAVLTFNTLENNLKINLKFSKYLIGSYELDLDQHFPSKTFMKIAFLREISSK